MSKDVVIEMKKQNGVYVMDKIRPRFIFTYVDGTAGSPVGDGFGSMSDFDFIMREYLDSAGRY